MSELRWPRAGPTSSGRHNTQKQRIVHHSSEDVKRAILEKTDPQPQMLTRALGLPVKVTVSKEVIMLPWAWDPQLWAEQLMYFGWLLMGIVGVALALIMLGAVLEILAQTKDEATSKLNPHRESLVHVLHRRQRKSADV